MLFYILLYIYTSYITGQRGRKGTDPRELLLKLEVLVKYSNKFGIRKEIQLYMHLISAMYDTYIRNIDDYMSISQWRTCSRYLLKIIKLLESNNNIILTLIPPEDVADIILGSGGNPKKKVGLGQDGDGEGTGEAHPPILSSLFDDGKGPLRVVGSLEAFILRLHEEYNKSLQQINPHTQVILNNIINV